MGRPSQKWYSARRPGKRERARVKKHRRRKAYISFCGGDVVGASHLTLVAGRKKWDEFYRSQRNPYGANCLAKVEASDVIYPSDGEPISKAGTVSGDGQPVSTAECNSRPAEANSEASTTETRRHGEQPGNLTAKVAEVNQFLKRRKAVPREVELVTCENCRSLVPPAPAGCIRCGHPLKGNSQAAHG
jgi:hypothetical protein